MAVLASGGAEARHAARQRAPDAIWHALFAINHSLEAWISKRMLDEGQGGWLAILVYDYRHMYILVEVPLRGLLSAIISKQF
eukprot:6183598-Pleurochrysis_carterae.AAC.2